MIVAVDFHRRHAKCLKLVSQWGKVSNFRRPPKTLQTVLIDNHTDRQSQPGCRDSDVSQKSETLTSILHSSPHQMSNTALAHEPRSDDVREPSQRPVQFHDQDCRWQTECQGSLAPGDVRSARFRRDETASNRRLRAARLTTTQYTAFLPHVPWTAQTDRHRLVPNDRWSAECPGRTNFPRYARRHFHSASAATCAELLKLGAAV